MALAKPPKSTLDRRAEALIDQAPAVQNNTTETRLDVEDVPVTVRIPKAMLRDIERAVKRRPIKTPRHTWLMEAIYAKWEQEKKSR